MSEDAESHLTASAVLQIMRQYEQQQKAKAEQGPQQLLFDFAEEDNR